jgi:4a-hydroxytetrahydrobiopterin dehydratase
MSLEKKHCTPCKKGTPPLGAPEIALLAPEVKDWKVTEPDAGQARRLSRRFEFRDFRGAMSFLNRVASVAEAEQHHPDFCVRYNHVDVTLWTHAIGGLSENDFILAAKIDTITDTVTDVVGD